MTNVNTVEEIKKAHLVFSGMTRIASFIKQNTVIQESEGEHVYLPLLFQWKDKSELNLESFRRQIGYKLPADMDDHLETEVHVFEELGKLEDVGPEEDVFHQNRKHKETMFNMILATSGAESEEMMKEFRMAEHGDIPCFFVVLSKDRRYCLGVFTTRVWS